MKRLSLAATMAAFGIAFLLGATVSHAQCTNLSGSPAPEVPKSAGSVKLRYFSDGPGGGNDKIVLKKPLSDTLVPPATFDPQNDHSLHVTLSVNVAGGPLMWTVSIPPTTLWSPASGNGWNFNDPSLTFGVRRARVIVAPGGNAFAIKKLIARGQDIANAPVDFADTVDIQVEVEDTGVGFCFGGPTFNCTSGNPSVKQVCR